MRACLHKLHLFANPASITQVIMVDEKQLKAAKKEGGKKGVDAAGMSDLGGVKYFHITVDTPEGDVELLRAVLEVRCVR